MRRELPGRLRVRRRAARAGRARAPARAGMPREHGPVLARAPRSPHAQRARGSGGALPAGARRAPPSSPRRARRLQPPRRRRPRTPLGPASSRRSGATWHQPGSSAMTVADTVSARASIMRRAAAAERRRRAAERRRHAAQRLPSDRARAVAAARRTAPFPPSSRPARPRPPLTVARHHALGDHLPRASHPLPAPPTARPAPARVRSSSSARCR